MDYSIQAAAVFRDLDHKSCVAVHRLLDEARSSGNFPDLETIGLLVVFSMFAGNLANDIERYITSQKPPDEIPVQ